MRALRSCKSLISSVELIGTEIIRRKGVRCPGRWEEWIKRSEWGANEGGNGGTEFTCGGFIGKGNNEATTRQRHTQDQPHPEATTKSTLVGITHINKYVIGSRYGPTHSPHGNWKEGTIADVLGDCVMSKRYCRCRDWREVAKCQCSGSSLYQIRTTMLNQVKRRK
jgi:hypothetical protein